MIIQEQADQWDSSLLAELERWQRRILARPGTKKNKTRRVVQLVSPAGKVFTSSSSLFSFLQQNKQSGGSLSEDTVREEVSQLFRLREEERHGRVRAKIPRAKISSTPTSSRRREEGTACDTNEAQDFSQLLPSQPLSPGELSQVERIITLEEDLVQLSQDLQDLDDIDFPRLEDEQMICDVPLTFRRD